MNFTVQPLATGPQKRHIIICNECGDVSPVIDTQSSERDYRASHTHITSPLLTEGLRSRLEYGEIVTNFLTNDPEWVKVSDASRVLRRAVRALHALGRDPEDFDIEMIVGPPSFVYPHTRPLSWWAREK